MTQHRTEYSQPYVHPSQQHAPQPQCGGSLSTAVFGTVFFEVVLRSDGLPALPGWTLRLWPQARLGDATLEATPARGQGVDELLQGLKAQGIQTLGPVRYRRF